MTHLTHRLLAWLLRLGLIGLILLAGLMTVLRLALPVADRYRDAVTETLSERLGYPLQVANLTLRLVGWSPRLVLGDVAIACPTTGNDLLRLRALELDLDPLASLRTGRPQLRSLTLVGARLVLHRNLDGRVSLVGLTALGVDDPHALALFLRQGRLRLTDGEVTYIDDALDGGVIRLTAVHLRLRNNGQVHQLELSAQPVGDGEPTAAGLTAAQLRVVADLRGDASDLTRWNGDLYLSLSGGDLATLVPWTLLEPGFVHTDTARLETWNQLRDGTLVESRGRFGLRGVTLRSPMRPWEATPGSGPVPSQTPTAPTSGPARLENLSGLVRVTHRDGGWRVQVADLGLAVGGAVIPDLDLDLRLDGEGRPRDLDLAAAGFDLQGLSGLVRAWPLPLSAPLDPDLIAALDPRARIEDLAARIRLPPHGSPIWEAAALVRGLAVDRYRRVPAFTGLDARLHADQDGGEVHLGSTGLDLDPRPLFGQPLHLNHLSGILTWGHRPAGGWRLEGRNLELENADLAGRVRFTLDLPGPAAAPGTGPFLDLRTNLHDGDVSQVRRYLPVGIIKPELNAWLTRALVAGTVTQADLVLRGPLMRYPFREQEGRFELLLDYQDLVLDYQRDWPPIRGAAGGLRFLNQGLEIWTDTGRIYDTALTQGRTEIPDLWHLQRMLIHGEGDGPFADGLRVLTDTPLAAHLGPLARSLAVQGPVHLVLDLDVPLIKGGIMGVDGHLSWPGPAPAGLSLKGTPLTLTRLSGMLGFTGNSLGAEAIHAQLWERPVTLAIATRNPADASSATTEIRARGRLPVPELANRFPTSAWGLARGDLDWDLRINLRNADLKTPSLPLDFTLTSDLRGLALDLPQPLGKTADRPQPLTLNGALVPARSLAITGTAEPLAWNLVLDLAASAPRLARGRVTLGASRAEPPSGSGLIIDGTLAELNLPAWSDWWDRVGAGFPDAAGPSGAPGPDPVSADLRIARLDLGDADLTGARVQAAQTAAGWDLQLNSKELAGRVLTAAGKGTAPATVALERLDLKALVPTEAAAAEMPARKKPPKSNPTRPPPALDLRVAELRWGDVPLGRLALDLRPGPGELRVSRLSFEGPGDTHLTGDADWLQNPDGGRVQLALDLKSSDTGPLLKTLDYSAVLSAAPVDGRLRLTWPGAFGDFALARAQGRIELDVGPGRLLDVDPGVGRVLGFLNLGELSRRLSLDFKDLYEQGFVFDRITGRINLGGGQARLETFDIDGPASDIRVSGFTDLRARTFDQTVTVEPSIGTSVALASSVVGGPVVGAAVYLVDRVSGGALDRLGSFQYRMTGPWTKPEFTRLGWEPFAQGAAAMPVPAGESADPGSAPSRAGENYFLE